MSTDKKIHDFNPAIRVLLMKIDDGIKYKQWLRGQLRSKGFVYKTNTKYKDRQRRKNFALQLVDEQKIIDQYRAAIKLLKKHSKP
jgi:hypothetical protein